MKEKRGEVVTWDPPGGLQGSTSTLLGVCLETTLQLQGFPGKKNSSGDQIPDGGGRGQSLGRGSTEGTVSPREEKLRKLDSNTEGRTRGEDTRKPPS